jgi:hypothetical protein
MSEHVQHTGEHYQGVDKFAVFGLILIMSIMGFLVWKLLELDAEEKEEEKKK